MAAEAGAQRSRLLLWTPVAFGAGAAAYLGLAQEPPAGPAVIAAAAAALVATGVFRWVRNVWICWAAAMAAMTVLGFACAKLHSDAMAAPIAPARPGMVRVDGWVADIDTPGQRGERLLIAPVRIAGLNPWETPHRIRVTIAADGGPESAPAPGSPISVIALVNPPPGPASPGAYDFARDAWFGGVGGVGLATRQPELTLLPPAPWRLRLEMAVNALRWRVATRLAHDIRAALGPDDGGAAGLAAAVTTSHQDWMAPQERDALRGSGLAHMLAIAGLHTAAVSGFAFFAFRFLVALWPWLAVRVDGKKAAALAALGVVGCYLVLSGAHAPARRAAITASVAFVAILLDRRAVSLHSLAVAAMIILAMEPDVVVQPGFEMSFCATASLVALAEVWRHAPASTGLPWPLRLLQGGRDWLIALATVSLVAGAATGPFTIQHFNRVANYGVLANLTADFVASAILMPSLAICLLLQTLGIDGPIAVGALSIAGWAARTVISLGRFFSMAPGAALTVSSAPEIALAVSYLGIVFACLWRGWLRIGGIAAAFAVALWPRPPAPAAWIAADGGAAAVVREGEVVALRPGVRTYATGMWAQRRNLRLPADLAAGEALQASLFDCDRASCAPKPGASPAIGGWWTRRKPKPGALADLCRGAEILVLRADVASPAACDGLTILRRGDFEAGGSAELFADGPGRWRLVWAQPIRGRRPWSLSDTVE
ncbi:MAG TPA: ComEC/Rec2 family competence protein [Caulobacteraceae bacterium]|nr:ComEC/Rec2 family competence protein [Caulobacteraceae bacterium]